MAASVDSAVPSIFPNETSPRKKHAKKKSDPFLELTSDESASLASLAGENGAESDEPLLKRVGITRKTYT